MNLLGIQVRLESGKNEVKRVILYRTRIDVHNSVCIFLIVSSYDISRIGSPQG